MPPTVSMNGSNSTLEVLMSRPFRQGVLAGVFAPIAFVAAFCWWTLRFTGRLPMPLVDDDDSALTLKLVAPEQVPDIWQQWRLKLEPLWARIRAMLETLHTAHEV